MLEVNELVKEFRGGVRANDGITLSVAEGELFGLLGPNGAGKTTLVNQVLGLLGPTSGSITLDGVDVVEHPDHARRSCSFAPQGNVPIDSLTPAEAVELLGRVRGGGRRESARRAAELFDALAIGEWSKTRGKMLSGGVRRLVAFCMAAVRPGRLVILDEPTNDVDPLRRRMLWQQVSELSARGSAVLLVTHNVLEAERVVDRLAIIDHGRIQGVGTPASLKGEASADLRLELTLEPGAVTPELLSCRDTVRIGRRVLVTIEGDDVVRAVEWARAQQTQGTIEEYSLGSATLEDTYVRMVSSANGETPAGFELSALGPTASGSVPSDQEVTA